MCLCKKRVSNDQTAENSPRINGWHIPLNGLQVGAWIVILLTGLMTFGVEVVALPVSSWPPAFVCLGVGYVIHVALLIAATTIDPADDNAKERLRNTNRPLAKFDRSVHRHVIENSYCHICQVPVGTKSKHCSACNKCVAVFDHHCKWLNNCIGEKNYRLFLLTVLSALLESIGMLVLSLIVFINAVQQFQWLNPDVWWSTKSSNNATQVTFQVFIAVKILVLVLAAILLLQLFSFHILLVYRKMTTYEYIKRSMAKSERKKASREVAPTPAMENGPMCTDPVDSTAVNEAANTNSPRVTVKAVSEIVDKDVPKHALLKGNKAPAYNTTSSSNGLCSAAHQNNTYVGDGDGTAISSESFSNILNSSNNSNQLQSEVATLPDRRDLPHTVPDRGDVDISTHGSKAKNVEKPTKRKIRPLPPLYNNIDVSQGNYPSAAKPHFRKLPPISSNA